MDEGWDIKSKVYRDRDVWQLSRRAYAFAGKWRAEAEYRRESGLANEPTDDALRDAFKHCARPPKPEMYTLIREHISHWSWEPPRLVRATQKADRGIAPSVEAPTVPARQAKPALDVPLQSRTSVNVIRDLDDY
jgi:hypothetical protein